MKGRLKWKARVDLCIRQDLQTSITLKFMLTIVFLEIIMLFLSSPPSIFFFLLLILWSLVMDSMLLALHHQTI